jgi:hypothetical protein
MSLVENLLHEDEEKLVKCRREICGWKGKIKDADRRRIETPIQSWNALAGREGWEYVCPRCGSLVATYYTKMS